VFWKDGEKVSVEFENGHTERYSLVKSNRAKSAKLYGSVESIRRRLRRSKNSMPKLKEQNRQSFDEAMRATGYSAELKDIHAALDTVTEKSVEFGRLSVLLDFDNMCAADAFVGFPAEEWAAIKKFFEWNKQISGWDKKSNV
jgi:hypothetical protein